MSQNAKEKMVRVFRSVFMELTDADSSIVEKSTRMDVASWDSANHLMLILCIEEEFTCRISDEAGGSMESFQNALWAVTGQ